MSTLYRVFVVIFIKVNSTYENTNFKIGNRRSLVEFCLNAMTIQLFYQGAVLLGYIDFKIDVLVLLPV